MQAIVTSEKNGIRFYLTPENLGTDIPERAATFRDLTDAALTAVKQNAEPGWQGWTWLPAYRMRNGAIAMPD